MMDRTVELDPDRIRKIQSGLSATAEQIFQLIHDPDIDFLKVLLKNTHFNEEHLLVLLKRRDLPEHFIDTIYQRQKDSLSHRAILALAKNPAVSASLIRTLLPLLRLFELVDLCLIPGVTTDQKLAAERTILQRLPTTPLGSKITLARRGTANIVGALLKEGQPQLFEICLGNPRLREADIYQFLRSATASAETISLVARHSRWNQRPNLRLAILKNSKTPDIWFTLWLPKLPRRTLQQVLAGYRSNRVRRRLIEVELKRRRGS